MPIPTIYPDLNRILSSSDSPKITTITTKDSLIDSHAYFLTSFFIYYNLKNESQNQENKIVILKSFRLRKFEIAAILTKSGLNVSKLESDKLLKIYGIDSENFENLKDFLDTNQYTTETNNENAQSPNQILLLDGLTSILEEENYKNSDKLIRILINLEARYSKIIYKTEINENCKVEIKLQKYLKARSGLKIECLPTSFVSTSVHGKLVVENEEEEVYQRLYFVKDRVLKLNAVGLS